MPCGLRSKVLPLWFALLMPGAMRAEIILAVSGPALGGTGADPISVSWESTAEYVGVQISALLGNGGNPESDGTAVLTGPVTAESPIAIPYGFEDWVPLFGGLDLPPGTYTLTIASPNPPDSFLNWLENFNPVVTGDQQTRLLGYNGQPYRPGLPGYMFSVNGTRANPEPGTMALLAAGLGALGYMARRRAKIGE